MASLLTKNALLTGRMLTRSVAIAPKINQYSRNISYNTNNKSVFTARPVQQLTFSRGFAEKSEGKNHLKEGLPEQYQWTADHLEKYLRNFAASRNYAQADVDHLIKTFVAGPTSAKDFFNLDRDSLASKIGKGSPERTKMANDLVAEVWKESQAVGQQMQNYGAVFVGVAAVIFGAWAYNHFSGSDSSKSSSSKDSKDSKDSKSGSKDDNIKKTAQAFKDDGAVGKQFTEKGAIGGTAQKIGGPLDKEGAIGKQFTKDGAIGGAVQKKAEEKEDQHSSGKSSSKNDNKNDSKNDYKNDSKKDSKKDSKSDKDSENDKKKAAQAFKDDGAVGKQFTEKGAIGGAAQKVGGPLAKDGVVGKQFTKDGAIGGAVQKKAEEKEEEHDKKSKSRN